jgi:hypothetical protein
MTETAPTTTPNRSRWLYQALAITGIAVGSVIIVAGLYLHGHWNAPIDASTRAAIRTVVARRRFAEQSHTAFTRSGTNGVALSLVFPRCWWAMASMRCARGR